MSDQDDRTPITPPAQHQVRDMGRYLAEGIVELVPGGGILTGLLRSKLPSQSERNRDDWEQVISDRSNEHGDRLDRHEDMLAPATETISGLPAQLIAHLVQDCPNGWAEKWYDLDALSTRFPEADEQAIKDAAYDLDALGLLHVRALIGGWSVALAENAYEQIDRQIMGWDTKADAMAIARLMLSEDTGHAPELHEKTGWSMRRFYPAFRFLLPVFPAGRIRMVNHPDYPVLGVLLANEDKAKLRRIAARSEEGL